MVLNLLSYERKEGHHNEWWTASREAHSKRVELTSGLSVGMSLSMFLSMFVCKRVSRGSLSANQQSFWDAKRR